ncbi:4-alpha-glucanotransferase DPE2 [Aduncisulcus paluster]|uniref:4-alpha-glucanotransferase n=1 Tax=Aduncisulcus paluster TaxID=2918883 RepID=A0ABQ5K7W0_9EUKA|nr:4-alpha-glucanotransferase DPE2 [Aduncisulcus paluster]
MCQIRIFLTCNGRNGRPVLSGSHFQLGMWKPELGIPLYPIGKDKFYAEFEISNEIDVELEFKYFWLTNGNEHIWDVIDNRKLMISSNDSIVEFNDCFIFETYFTDVVAKSSAVRVVMKRPPEDPLKKLYSTHSDETATLEFSVYVPYIRPDDEVIVVGSIDELGSWESTAGFSLSHAEYPYFYGKLNVRDISGIVEFKICLIGADGTPLWESGLNRSVLLNTDTTKTVVRCGMFRYPDPEAFKAAGMVIPVFSIRTEESCGVGEFNDLKKMGDWCHECHLRLLQVLPVNDTTLKGVHWHDTYPYSPISVFALHPLYMNVPDCGPMEGYEMAEYISKGKELDKLTAVDYEAAAGMVIPVFSIRTEESCGVGEFNALKKMGDWCHECHLRLLQVLPVNDTTLKGVHWHDTYPYSPISVFALHPLYMNVPDCGPMEGYEMAEYISKGKELDKLTAVDYEAVLAHKLRYLRLIYERLEERGEIDITKGEFKEFIDANPFWLKPYCLYKSLQEAYGTGDFMRWQSRARNPRGFGEEEEEDAIVELKREKEVERKDDDDSLLYQADVEEQGVKKEEISVDAASVEDDDEKELPPLSCELPSPLSDIFDMPAHSLFDEYKFHLWLQFNLHRQLKAATDYCTSLGVVLKVDIPVGVSPRGADAWWWRDYFRLDTQIGAPPDAFSNGYNWEMPTYNWENMEKDGYQWWVERFRQLSNYFSAYRVNHILGWFRIWEIPEDRVGGIAGRFRKCHPIHVDHLRSLGIHDIHRLCKPFLPEDHVKGLLKDVPLFVDEWFEYDDGKRDYRGVALMKFKTEVNSEKKLIKKLGLRVNPETEKDRFESLKDHHVKGLLKDVPLFVDEWFEYDDGKRDYRGVALMKFKTEVNSEKKLIKKLGLRVNPETEKDRFESLKDRLISLTTNYILMWDNDHLNIHDYHFHPRFNLDQTHSFRHLPHNIQTAMKKMMINYYYRDHQDIWGVEADKKMSTILKATKMLPCGEDLGLLADVVVEKLQKHRVCGLRVQRMPADDSIVLPHPNDYPYDVVATTSTHDCANLRAWWIQPGSRHQRDKMWYDLLGEKGPCPNALDHATASRIIDMHMFSPAFLVIFPLQDWLTLSPMSCYKGAEDETIQHPEIVSHYWRYRMHLSVEDLMVDSTLIGGIKARVLSSGRFAYR